jgi:DtxR family Mn-dependent transcriptional regulator
MKITSGLEDYLEVISNCLKTNSKVKAIDISRELQVSRASVSEALKRLAEQGFINYGRYGTISITEKGSQAAESVIKRHTLIRDFLRNILGLDENEANENACKIEHVISDKLIDNLDKFMEYNKANPQFSSKFINSIK